MGKMICIILAVCYPVSKDLCIFNLLRDAVYISLGRMAHLMENVKSGKEQIKEVKSSLHGVGISAMRSIRRGDVIFSESPILFLQSVPNRQDDLVCAACAKFVGTIGTQLSLLSRESQRHEHLNDFPRFPNDVCLSPMYPCLNQCGEVYCSDDCRSLHHTDGHYLLCTGSISEVAVCANLFYSVF